MSINILLHLLYRLGGGERETENVCVFLFLNDLKNKLNVIMALHLVIVRCSFLRIRILHNHSIIINLTILPL